MTGYYILGQTRSILLYIFLSGQLSVEAKLTSGPNSQYKRIDDEIIMDKTHRNSIKVIVGSAKERYWMSETEFRKYIKLFETNKRKLPTIYLTYLTNYKTFIYLKTFNYCD